MIRGILQVAAHRLILATKIHEGTRRKKNLLKCPLIKSFWRCRKGLAAPPYKNQSEGHLQLTQNTNTKHFCKGSDPPEAIIYHDFWDICKKGLFFFSNNINIEARVLHEGGEKMKDINELIGKLKIETEKEDKESSFWAVIKDVELFYTENFFLGEYEVAIFITNKEKTVMSFACPQYLVNSGMIPVSSTEAITSNIYRTGRAVMENNLQQQKHLSIFEIIRTPEGKIKPISKMIAVLIEAEGEKLGVIEISRRTGTNEGPGEDFSESDLLFLQKTIKIIAPFLKKVIPENFRGKIT